jgi:hypothetical protein
MISLKTLLKEVLLKEFDKSKLDFISRKLNISPENQNFQKIMNALDSQGIKYSDLKQSIEKGEIKSFDDIKSLKTTSKTNIRKQEKSNIEVILDNGEILLIKPKTPKASCYYGSGTKWCTAGKDSKYWFNYYKSNNEDYYILIDKSKPSQSEFSKIGIVIHRKENITMDREIFNIIEIFDAKDNEMREEQIVKYFEYLKSKGIDIPKLLNIKNYQVYDPKYKSS